MIPAVKKILYATDLSKNLSYAFYYAADMSKRYNAKIVILHSVEPVAPNRSCSMQTRVTDYEE